MHQLAKERSLVDPTALPQEDKTKATAALMHPGLQP
jgi:hypothetical protein